jgi:hypothetical protein
MIENLFPQATKIFDTRKLRITLTYTIFWLKFLTAQYIVHFFVDKRFESGYIAFHLEEKEQNELLPKRFKISSSKPACKCKKRVQKSKI